MAARKSEAVRKAVLTEHASGNRTVRGIVAALARRKIKISVGTVNSYLRAAGAVSAALSAPPKPRSETAPKAPARADQVPAPRSELVASVTDAAQAHAAAWERLYQAHGHTLRELERRLAALGHEAACPKCGGGFEASPDFGTLKQLRTFAAELLADIQRLRPVERQRPEDDPANVEAARVVVATIRSRLAAQPAAA